MTLLLVKPVAAFLDLVKTLLRRPFRPPRMGFLERPGIGAILRALPILCPTMRASPQFSADGITRQPR